MGDFSVGDRVVLKPSWSWKQPWRGMGDEGRMATITCLADHRRWDPIKIVFDVKRKGAKPRELWLSGRDIIHAPSLEAGEVGDHG